MRDFSLTVKARAARDPEFAWELITELLEENKRLRAALNEFVWAMDEYGHPDKSLRAAKKALGGETCNE